QFWPWTNHGITAPSAAVDRSAVRVGRSSGRRPGKRPGNPPKDSMINSAPLARFRALDDGPLLRPIYADYAFANIPQTLEALLTGAPRVRLPPDCFGGAYPAPDKIVVILLDAFGWECWLAHHHRFRATRRVVERGALTPISALFPSTTSAAISTLHLG